MTDVEQLEIEMEKHVLLEVAHRIVQQIEENIQTMISRKGGDLLNSISVDNSEIDEGHVYITVGGEEPGFTYAVGLEFGTGIFGPRKRMIEANHLTPTGKKGFMKFKAYEGAPQRADKIPGNISFKKDGYIYTQKIRGMEPKFFVTRAVASVMQKEDEIVQEVYNFYMGE